MLSKKNNTITLLQFKENTNFDKLFINTEYVFDVIFWVETELVKDIKGTEYHLRNVVAVQKQENGPIEILLNVASDANACDPDQQPIENFENGLEIQQQILDFLKEHIVEIKYNIKDRIFDVSEIENSIKDMLNRHVEEDSWKIYNKIKALDEVPFNLELENGIKFENTIHYAKDKNCYLLESRLFDDGKDGQMIDSYLRIINADMTLVDNRIITEQHCDDSWDYADWKPMETRDIYKL